MTIQVSMPVSYDPPSSSPTLVLRPAAAVSKLGVQCDNCGAPWQTGEHCEYCKVGLKEA